VKDAIRKGSDRSSPIIKVASPMECGSISSVASSLDHNVCLDPYAELESLDRLSTDLWSSVKRSSSYTQVSDHYHSNFHPKFLQRRHSLTSISGKCSPTEDKKQKTPWRMVNNLLFF
jgi:hypothetical protein